ncbi:hypothetical protein [Paraburkholderia solisilvae]|uniref:Uncharacterized protein n=1 Tax=Paraburkholderia solisilvae TaxID=624376 RepID=A0A6J5F229_9BURK|nr:hypothetical protein [Paraburkholderia solisilvae]CAB3771751.1 hypothetical protein LMG29739_06108 [Paraburkholderia solisilvae]
MKPGLAGNRIRNRKRKRMTDTVRAKRLRRYNQMAAAAFIFGEPLSLHGRAIRKHGALRRARRVAAMRATNHGRR